MVKLIFIGAVRAATLLPVFQWSTQVDLSGVWAYRICLSESSPATCEAPTWDSGWVWQENEPFTGTAHYAGNNLQPGASYSWAVWEMQLRSASGELVNKSWAAGAGQFTVAASPTSLLDEARAAVNLTNVTSIYLGTAKSITGRIAPSGWMPTSVASQTYGGMFVRDSTAGVFALLELEENALAGRVLRFMLSAMQAANLTSVPHVLLGGPDNVTGFDMVDQPDGAYSLIISWAEYITRTGDTAMLADFYPLVSRFLDRYCADGATYANTTIPYFNATLQLLWNPNLEHSRAGHYWSCYDVLTNQFAVEALRRMAAFATARGDVTTAARWQALRRRVLAGIAQALSYSSANETLGQTVYAELRGHWHEWGGAIIVDPAPLLWGISWVNIGPVAAVGPAIMRPDAPESLESVGLSATIMDATFDAYRRLASFFWEADAYSTQAPQTHINASTLTDPARVVIGKGWAWFISWLAFRDDLAGLADAHRWLAAAAFNNTLYGESYVYDCIRLHQTGCWGDIGNAEQSSWFVWAQVVIRKRLGLPWRLG
eukprot:m.20350 g.20350  ORF g.20350 m.20350 type:complete len:544 (-) comp3523_c0_seq2:106-1737(-)